MMALQGRDITFRYHRGPLLLDHVNIEVRAGQCVGLMGPSGCGKTTLCHILAGIIPRSIPARVTGKVLVCGTELSELSPAALVQKIGVVFQDPDAQLFSPTVEDEIAFGPENICLPRDEIEQRIGEALAAVGMGPFRKAETETLSQGQKQLIALGAVLALRPQILICDEVFSQLDAAAAHLVQSVIRAEKRKGRAVLLVAHDEQDLAGADRVFALQAGQLREVYL